MSKWEAVYLCSSTISSELKKLLNLLNGGYEIVSAYTIDIGIVILLELVEEQGVEYWSSETSYQR